jgi:hypothetical protein
VARFVIVFSDGPELLENVRRTLSRDSRFFAIGDTIHRDGAAAPLTNIYRIEMAPADWDGREPAGEAQGSVPDPRTATTLLFECRSAAWIAEAGKLLAQGVTSALAAVCALVLASGHDSRMAERDR